MNNPYQLGDRVKDEITGFCGVVTARIEYISGCEQCGVAQETLDKDGKLPETIYFDWVRLKANGKSMKLQPGNAGGPQVGSPGRQA